MHRPAVHIQYDFAGFPVAQECENVLPDVRRDGQRVRHHRVPLSQLPRRGAIQRGFDGFGAGSVGRGCDGFNRRAMSSRFARDKRNAAIA